MDWMTQFGRPRPEATREIDPQSMAELNIPREDRLAVLSHQPMKDVHGLVYDRYDRLREKRGALQRWERHLASILGDNDSADTNVVALGRA